MATKDEIDVDVSKVNPYGQTTEQLKELSKSYEEQLKALEDRYAQPNWWKVAAGFAKPQLGGFLASLGSASEALGENLEQQRANQLPISQMRVKLAQNQMLLDNKQKASEIIAKAQSEKRTLTPIEIEEVSNLDPVRGQQIIQSQDVRAKTVANNMALTKQQYEARGLPMPPLNEMGLPDTGKFPVGGGSDQTDPGRLTPPPTITTLPNGARVNEDQARLVELGIPVISGVRTKEEQQALYDNRATNANPVAAPGTSQHEFGNAIDVDVNKITAEDKAILKRMGYTQPMPDKDPGHWEKAGAEKPAPSGQKIVLSSSTPSYSPLFTSDQVKESQGLTDKTLNEKALARYESLASVANTATYQQNKNAINSMISTLVDNQDLARAVSNPLAQKGGAIGAALNAADKGFGVSIMGLAGNIQLPVQAAIIGSFDPNTERPFYDKLKSQAATIAQLQQQMSNVNPGTIRNGEIELYKNASVNPAAQGPNVMLYNLQYTSLNNDMLHDMYERANKIMKNEDPKYVLNPNSRTRMMDIMTSPVMSDIAASYEKKFKALDKQFESTLKVK